MRLVSNGILQEQPVLKVDVNSDNERGLLGIAIMTKDTVFLYYTESYLSSEDNEPLINEFTNINGMKKKKYLLIPS